MSTTAAQQIALYNALVAPKKRVEISKCNMRIDPKKTQKEPTYRVVLDALALTTCYPAFLITADVPIGKKRFFVVMEVFREILQICPRLPNQEFDEPPSEEEILSFIKELGHTRKIKNITTVVVDHMHQPWRAFAATINKCLSWKIIDFTFQIDNKDAKKQEKMYYPRFTKAIIHHVLSKDMSISMRNRMFMHTTQDDCNLGTMRFVSKDEDTQVYGALIPTIVTTLKIRDSLAYQTYHAFATGAATPKTKRIYKKPASPMIKTTTTSLEETPSKKKSAPAKKDVSSKNPLRKQLIGVQIRDTPDVSISKKKAPATTDTSKGIELLSDVALLEEAQLKKVLKRSKREMNIHQACGLSDGANLESEVPDELKGYGNETNEQGDEDDVLESDDDHQHANNEQTESNNPRTSNDEEETQDDKYVHTLEDYVPTNDKTNDETNDVDEEEYDKINRELYGDANVRLTDVEPDDEDKGNKEMTNAETVDVEHKNVIQESASTTKATTSATVVPNFETLTALHQRIANLEKDVKELKDVDNSTKLISTIQSEVPKAEHSVPAEIVERLRQQYAPRKRIEDIREIKIEHTRKQQVPKETTTSSDTTTLEEFDHVRY
ncbi:hypothetical protein Tco_1048053 [Tanacetum coccineum]